MSSQMRWRPKCRTILTASIHRPHSHRNRARNGEEFLGGYDVRRLADHYAVALLGRAGRIAQAASWGGTAVTFRQADSSPHTCIPGRRRSSASCPNHPPASELLSQAQNLARRGPQCRPRRLG